MRYLGGEYWKRGVVTALSVRVIKDSVFMVNIWVPGDSYEEARRQAVAFWAKAGIEDETRVLSPQPYPMMCPPSDVAITDAYQVKPYLTDGESHIPLGTRPFLVLNESLFYRGVRYGIVMGDVMNPFAQEHSRREHLLRSLWRGPQVESWRSPVYKILYWLISERPGDLYGLSFTIEDDITVRITTYSSDIHDINPRYYLMPVFPFFDVEEVNQ